MFDHLLGLFDPACLSHLTKELLLLLLGLLE